MKFENQLKFYKCLEVCSDEQVECLLEYLHSSAIGLCERKVGCMNYDCYDAYILVLCEMNRRGLYEGRLV